jgi:hypothetical protein
MYDHQTDDCHPNRRYSALMALSPGAAGSRAGDWRDVLWLATGTPHPTRALANRSKESSSCPAVQAVLNWQHADRDVPEAVCRPA